MIEKKDYTYKELCVLMNDSVKSGKSKQLQLEKWKHFFEWENPKKQIFRITEVFETPKEIIDKRKNNGGTRTGAGAKAKIQEEFEIILSGFIYENIKKDTYYNANVPMKDNYTAKYVDKHSGQDGEDRGFNFF